METVGVDSSIVLVLVLVDSKVRVLVLVPPPVVQSSPSGQHPGSPLSPGPGLSQKVPTLQ